MIRCMNTFRGTRYLHITAGCAVKPHCKIIIIITYNNSSKDHVGEKQKLKRRKWHYSPVL